MTTPTPDSDIDEILDTLAVNYGHEDHSPECAHGELYREAKAKLQSLITAKQREAELKGRLVELDLLEQYLNLVANRKARQTIDEYKLMRLKDLEARLNELTQGSANNNEGRE